MSAAMPAAAAVRPLPLAAARARRWLLAEAAPLWAFRGRTAAGLFAERMTLQGVADPSSFRTFVQARHIFSFVAIGRMGWDGPWRALIKETMTRLLKSARRPDGLFVHRLTADGAVLDGRADLYDQAFVLLALGSAGGALGRDDWFDAAEDLFSRLETHWTHPAGGFAEGEIVDARIRRQNPHMHLFEALLALAEESGRSRFQDAADRMAALARASFIDPRSGALLEYFTGDLRPAPGIEGRIVEPGHCFEWAWLFERLAAAGRAEALPVSDGLAAFGRAHGICGRRNVCVNEVLLDGTVHDPRARLWPQTERLKAALARLRRARRAGDGRMAAYEAAEAAAAAAGLEQYMDVPTSGLWRDKLLPDGGWIEELAPGSSLYHIACAYAEIG